jgi:gluconolactonase
MKRRAFLAASVATAATATLGVAAAATETEGPFGETAVGLRVPRSEQLPLGPLPNSRYPDTHIEAIDKRFKGSVGTGAVERVATGFRWAEGPAYFAAGRYLIFSDIPNNRMMRLLEDDNHLSVFRYPSLNSNGNTVDPQGRLVSCEHTGRRVTRTEFDGTITVIADRYNGKRLNSPNDVVVASNGSIWFTDPTYGARGWYEGLHGELEQEKHNVYHVDPQSGEVKVVVDDFVEPNGILLSPDEKKLYVIDSGATDGPGNPAHIRVFDVNVGAGRCPTAKSSLMASLRDLPTACGATLMGTCGAAWAGAIQRRMGSAAMVRPETCSAKFICPRPAPIWSSVECCATGFIFVRARRSMRAMSASKEQQGFSLSASTIERTAGAEVAPAVSSETGRKKRRRAASVPRGTTCRERWRSCRRGTYRSNTRRRP